MENRNDNPLPTKHCTGCGEDKPEESFGVNRSNIDGRANHCLDCARAHDRERRGTEETPKDPKLEALKDAIVRDREGHRTPHPSECVEDVWKLYPRNEFAELWVKYLRDCKNSKSLQSVEKAIQGLLAATAQHREVSIGDISSLSDEDLGRAIKKLLSQPQLAEHTLPENNDDLTARIA